MALTVEDGTGLSTSDSLVSLAAHKAFMDADGTDYSAFTDDQIEQALRRASKYIGTAFVYAGTPINGRSQAFPFPMSGLSDAYGNDVDSASVPPEVAQSVSIAAVI